MNDKFLMCASKWRFKLILSCAACNSNSNQKNRVRADTEALFFQRFAILSRNRRFLCVTSLTAWRWLHSSHSIYLITFGILLRNQSKLYDFFGDPMIFSILKTIKILRIFFFTSFFSFYWYFIFWWSLSF